MNLSAKAWVFIVCGGPWATVLGEPLAAPDLRRELEHPPAAAEPAESPVDVQTWIQRESTVALLDGEFEADRRALLRQGWQGRSPTWIQSTAAVNLGDYPTLDDSAERADRALKTLEWVIDEQRRLAEGKPPARDGGNPDAAPADNWLRNLLPSRWVATLKAHREWVAAGGTALLVIVWGTTSFARRPSTRPQPPPEPPPPPRRRRRHRDLGHRPG